MIETMKTIEPIPKILLTIFTGVLAPHLGHVFANRSTEYEHVLQLYSLFIIFLSM